MFRYRYYDTVPAHPSHTLLLHPLPPFSLQLLLPPHPTKLLLLPSPPPCSCYSPHPSPAPATPSSICSDQSINRRSISLSSVARPPRLLFMTTIRGITITVSRLLQLTALQHCLPLLALDHYFPISLCIVTLLDLVSSFLHARIHGHSCRVRTTVCNARILIISLTRTIVHDQTPTHTCVCVCVHVYI